MPGDKTYFEARLPDPWQILGIQLRPFSLGHYAKLYRLNCAFVADTPTPATLGDLLLGLAVCAMGNHPDPLQDPFWQLLNAEKPRGGLAAVRHWFMEKIGRMAGKRPMTPLERQVFRVGRQAGLFDLAEKCRLFSDYIKAHSDAPIYWCEHDSGGKSSGAHWSHSILATLTSHCGYTMEQALNVPMAMALQDFFRYAEEQGIVRLASPVEAQFLREHGGL